MLQYLIILLDDTSVSYCHYENPRVERKLISLENLKAGILFGMKENLMIQFVYPDYELPIEYQRTIETIDHSKIMPSSKAEGADVVIFSSWDCMVNSLFKEETAYVLRTSKQELFENYTLLDKKIDKYRLNIAITDIDSFTEADFDQYKIILSELAETIKSAYGNRKAPQINILTDRMMLDKMNNCNAGWENITLAPDGLFYICPAFYFDKKSCSVGNLSDKLQIKNPQLYKLSYAPLCRKCDAYQCKRCIWLNWKTTLEVNTPSHEQCVVAHLERNASRELLNEIRTLGTFLPEKEIKEVYYLDPINIKDEL